MLLTFHCQPDLSIEEILKKLPRFEQPPNLSTFSPYDINAVDSELVTDKKKSAEQARFWRTCTAVALGLAGAVTLGVLSAFCWLVIIKEMKEPKAEVDQFKIDLGRKQFLPHVFQL